MKILKKYWGIVILLALLLILTSSSLLIGIRSKCVDENDDDWHGEKVMFEQMV